MASIYDGRNLPILSNYARAYEFWERAQQWRGETGEYDGRVLDKRSKKYVTIRKLNNNAIACRLHATDVVTFHPDGSLTIRPYSSIMTDEFTNTVLRFTNIEAGFNRGLISVGGHVYRAIDTLVLTPDPMAQNNYCMETKTEPFVITRINRRANALLKQLGYNAFRDWVKMLDVTGYEMDGGNPRPRYNEMNIDTMLADSACWLDLVTRSAGWVTTSSGARVLLPGKVVVGQTLTSVRERVYATHPEVIDKEVKPYLSDQKEVNAWLRGRYRPY